jgi:hypothetical protein
MLGRLQIKYAGANYHAMGRGDRQEAILWDGEDRGEKGQRKRVSPAY